MNDSSELLAEIDGLIAKAEAARRISPLDRTRNAELLYQHGELLTGLKMLRAHTDGIVTATLELSERVNALASLYSESLPNKGDWTIKPTMATRFRPRLHALLDLVRDTVAT